MENEKKVYKIKKNGDRFVGMFFSDYFCDGVMTSFKP